MQHNKKKNSKRDKTLDGKEKKTTVVEEEEARTGDAAENQDTNPDVEDEGKQEASETNPELERIEELEEQLTQLQTENSDLKNQYLRKQADFENFRKRMQREKQDAVKYANTNLLQDLITIIDDFERAIRSSEESRDFESFHSGIKMIEHQFISMLDRKYGLKRMESEGREFDPQMHEAINMEESSDVETQTVMEDYQKGYFLNDRVLRHAKVKVAIPTSESSSARESAEADSDNDTTEES